MSIARRGKRSSDYDENFFVENLYMQKGVWGRPRQKGKEELHRTMQCNLMTYRVHKEWLAWPAGLTDGHTNYSRTIFML